MAPPALKPATAPAQSHYFTPQAPPIAKEAADGAARRRLLAATVRGVTLEFVSGQGVFSRNALDDGTRVLLETLTLTAPRHICDLGCGWGPAGCFAAALWPAAQIAMVDINGAAVQLARTNARHNKLDNIAAWCGDGLGATRPAAFDAILCNPPVRAGNEVIGKMFEQSFAALNAGGALWVVLRTAQGAKSWQKRLAQRFGACDTMEIRHGYRILRSVRDVESA